MDNDKTVCDKCDKPNPIWRECNYCPECRDAAHKRQAKSYENLSGYKYEERRSN